MPTRWKKTLDKAEARFGQIDILFHSAGVGVEKPFLQTTREEWQRIIDIDLTGTFLCCQAVAKRMQPKQYGRIITVASTAGIRGGFGRAAYGAAKGGVITLSKVMGGGTGRTGYYCKHYCPWSHRHRTGGQNAL